MRSSGCFVWRYVFASLGFVVLVKIYLCSALIVVFFNRLGKLLVFATASYLFPVFIYLNDVNIIVVIEDRSM